MATIIGNRFNNILRSNPEEDIIDGGDGIDTVDYSASSKAVEVDLTAEKQRGGDADGDILINIENVTGSAFDDTLIGDKFDNVINAGNGTDYVKAGDGNDTVVSLVDYRVDTYFGGEGNDTLDYSNNAIPSGLEINLSQGTTVIAPRPVGEGLVMAARLDDKFSGFENAIGSQGNDKITGDGEDNRLEGRDGNDVIVAGAGADTIIGGKGTDIMSGFTNNPFSRGDGATDTFVFNATTEIGLGTTGDKIQKFEFGVDKIDFSAIDANPAVAGNQAFHFTTAFGQFDGTAGAILVRELTPSSGDDFQRNYLVSGDMNGDSIADFSLTISGPGSVNNGLLTTNDFIL